MDSVEQCLRWDFHFNFSNSELLSSADLIFAFADLNFAFAKEPLEACRCSSQFMGLQRRH